MLGRGGFASWRRYCSKARKTLGMERARRLSVGSDPSQEAKRAIWLAYWCRVAGAKERETSERNVGGCWWSGAGAGNWERYRWRCWNRVGMSSCKEEGRGGEVEGGGEVAAGAEGGRADSEGGGLHGRARSHVGVLERRRWSARGLVGALPAPVVGVAGAAGSGRRQRGVILHAAVSDVHLPPGEVNEAGLRA